MPLLTRCLAVVALLLSLRVAAADAPTTPAPPLEYEVKAAFLFNFAKFIEWPPARASEDFVIGVLGRKGSADRPPSGVRLG